MRARAKALGVRPVVFALAVAGTVCADDKPMLSAWTHVSVGVADLDVAMQLWETTFGFDVESRRDGPDAELAKLWGIDAEDISRQVVLTTPGNEVGKLHLIEFMNPDPPVRAGADVFDECPKNLDIYVDDLPARVAELKRKGLVFRNANHSEVVAPGGVTFREIHLPAHDEINVVLLQVVGDKHAYSEQGFAGMGPLITIVGDAAAERRFYRDAFKMELLVDNVLDGPEIERMVGLPPGAALDVSIWGEKGQHFGQMEVIDYRGVDGKDLYPRAKPKSLGTLHVTFRSDDLAALKASVAAAGYGVVEHGSGSTVFGSGEAITLRTPAGLRIDVIQVAD